MGFGMAKNIRKKISPESTLIIFDINHAAMDRFMKEFDNNVKIIQAKSLKEVAEIAVCAGPSTLPMCSKSHDDLLFIGCDSDLRPTG
jgi:hypothetical protein